MADAGLVQTPVAGQLANIEPKAPAGVFATSVVAVEHYTDRLFRFRTTRPASFRFRSGEFVMIGLPAIESPAVSEKPTGSKKPVYRAYSMASPSWDDELEFFSIKVPGGPLTEHLQKIKIGDTIWMRKKSTGTLVLDALLPGKRLYLISTGTGIAPFASLIRDPETYEKFESVILTHTCRDIPELQYGFDTVALAKEDMLVGEEASARLSHFASTTRQKSRHMGRITTLIEDGAFFTAVGMPPFNPSEDRVMLCGSSGMLRDLKVILNRDGFTEGANSHPDTFVIERAFVD